MCKNPGESCAQWNPYADKVFDGCILTKYCGVTAEYVGSPTSFTCADGQVGRSEEHDTIVINLDTFGKLEF